MKNNASEQNALTTDRSAAVLGLNEFSLFARIQMDEIQVARLRSGEMAILETELERMLRAPASKFLVPQNQETNWPDSRLGIEKHSGGLKRNGESIEYSVPNHPGQFTESEINSYRAVLGSIAEAKANQPYMQGALDALQNARWNLQHAEHDKGGHRANALNLVNQAINEVQAGIAVGGS